jgi:hypothetical protein
MVPPEVNLPPVKERSKEVAIISVPGVSAEKVHKCAILKPFPDPNLASKNKFYLIK